MESADTASRLERIQTHWTKLVEAHQAVGDEGQKVLCELLLRYHGAVYRYLLGTLRDPEKAEESTQEFALRFLRGDFRHADRGKGRFRDYLKTALRHLAVRHWEQEKWRKDRGPHPLPEGADLPAGPAEPDPLYDESWRQELLSQAWRALEQSERQTGVPHYTVLRERTDHPQLRSAQLAERLSARLGKPMSDVAVRKAVERARQQFAALLVDEVARSLGEPEADAVEQELVDLRLLEYCKAEWERRTGGAP